MNADRSQIGSPGNASARSWPLALAVIVLALIGAAVAVRYWPRAQPLHPAIAKPGAARGKSLLLITLDTLRADRVGCYGYDQAETPVIDRLADEGVRFAHAVSAVPMTLPAHCTIMTGLYPPAHGVRDNGIFRLTGEHLTLAESLKQHDYATAAFLAAFVLDARYGLDQGFDHYDDDLTLRHRLPTPTVPHNPQRPADVVVDAALAWLEAYDAAGAEQPYFLWVHLFDPHLPYKPPEPFAGRYRDRPYDGEVAFVDEQIGRLFTGLAALGLADSTVTVLVGDHGEGLGDHGEPTHRQLVYESTMRVPMILHAPGVVGPGQVIEEAAVGIVDIMPTILDLLGLGAAETGDGRSILSGGLDPERAFYIETLSPQLNDGWAPLFGLRRVADKYIDAPGPEYYDLATDPGELENLWDAGHEGAQDLASLLDEMRASFPATTAAAAVTPSPEEIRQLEALGYLGGATKDDGVSELDPKVMIHTFDERVAALDLLRRHRRDEAVASLEQLISKSPQSAELWSMLGHAQESLGRTQDAVVSARRATQLQPTNPEYLCTLASRLFAAGDEQAADEALAQAERLAPDYGLPWLIRARWALDQGRDDEALRCCRRAMDIDPVRCFADGSARAGLIHQRQGRDVEARAAFEAALAHDPRNGTALLARARLAIADGEPQQAIAHLQKLIDGQPEFDEGGRLLGRLHFDAGNARVAEGIFRLLLRRNPQDGPAHYELSRVLASRGRIDEALGHLASAAALEAIDFDALRSDPSFQALANDPRLEALQQGP
jgi:arylsulfatase A-like enzyme/cytochrome c-type biogenesis protein CcmH/NrfG